MSKISIVLVIKEHTHAGGTSFNNVDRFLRIGMRTYEQFLDVNSIADFFVIVPKKEYDSIKARLTTAYPNWPWRIIIEDVIVSKTLPDGWAKQQTAKLAIASLVKTPHYLIIDDDTYLTRPLAANDLFDDRGRALMNRCGIDFPFFFLWSAQVVDVDFDEIQDAPFHMAITPEIFVTDVVKDLVAFLERRYGTHMKWQEYLAEHKYTEYCTYWAYLIKLGGDTRTRLYACDDGAPSLYGYPTTAADQNMKEQVARSFENNVREGYFFSFVQSSLPHLVQDIEEQIVRHL